MGGAVEAPGGGSIAWWVAGASMVALLVVIAWPIVRAGQSESSGTAISPPMGVAGAPPDLSSMTPIEAADRLYQRVMTAVETGDEATVQQFLPMALGAYDLARPLNADGAYHLATLLRAGADFQGSLETAREGLSADPDHLLLLAAAGEAAEGMSALETARDYWLRFLDGYDAERARQLEEYTAHEFTLEASLTHAREFVGG